MHHIAGGSRLPWSAEEREGEGEGQGNEGGEERVRAVLCAPGEKEVAARVTVQGRSGGSERGSDETGLEKGGRKMALVYIPDGGEGTDAANFPPLSSLFTQLLRPPPSIRQLSKTPTTPRRSPAPVLIDRYVA